MVQVSELISAYQKELAQVEVPDLLKVAEILATAQEVFTCGNGGSAATAIHLASDLRAVGIRAGSLCENISVITRVANDISYDDVFRWQIKPIIKGKVLVVISCSGKSVNLVQAARVARRNHGTVIALLGSGGGRLKEIAHYSITLSSEDYGIIEGVHSCLCHIIAAIISNAKG